MTIDTQLGSCRSDIGRHVLAHARVMLSHPGWRNSNWDPVYKYRVQSSSPPPKRGQSPAYLRYAASRCPNRVVGSRVPRLLSQKALGPLPPEVSVSLKAASLAYQAANLGRTSTEARTMAYQAGSLGRTWTECLAWSSAAPAGLARLGRAIEVPSRPSDTSGRCRRIVAGWRPPPQSLSGPGLATCPWPRRTSG